MSNDLAKVKNLSQYLDLPAVTNRLSEKLGLEEAKRFKAALSSAVSVNPKLATECVPDTVVTAALIGHSLNLPPSPQLGYYYLVPYKNKWKKCTEAQFQIGYKGYIQLAMRSGYYVKLNVSTIKEGEFKGWNPLTEELSVQFIEDPLKRAEAETVGYCGYFEYTNGFKKTVYWTFESMQVHADKYSKAFSLANDKLLKQGKIPDNERWKYSSFWYSDFDAMALKTVLRQLLSKWGSMSVDMQVAFEHDIKTDSIPFDDAQDINDAKVGDEAGSEIIDVDPLEQSQEKPEAETDDDWRKP
jgi:recombination protein RecT